MSIPESLADRRKRTLLLFLDEIAAGASAEASVDEYASAPSSSGSGQSTKLLFETVKQNTEAPDSFNTFYNFESCIGNLDRTLQACTNAVQQLGSSVGLFASAYQLRYRFDQVLRLFRGNVRALYPDRHLHLPETRRWIDPVPRYYGDRSVRYELIATNVNALPSELEALIGDLDKFCQRIQEIPEFTDDVVGEVLETSIRALSDHLRLWLISLKRYEMLSWTDCRRFLNELSGEMQEDLERLSQSIANFVDVGIPIIKHTQRRIAGGLQNLSTIAIFFSGVSASALQYSFGNNVSTVDKLVNFSWTTALVASLASAVNSQLAYRWQLSSKRSPHPKVPAWVSRWLKDAPLVFLIVSVVLFALGLVCFTFSAFPGTFIPITTSIFTGLSSIALLVVGIWTLSEEWTYAVTKGSHWLIEVISDPKRVFGDDFSWLRSIFAPPNFPREETFPRAGRFWRRVKFRLAQWSGAPSGIAAHIFPSGNSLPPVLPTMAPDEGVSSQKVEERPPSTLPDAESLPRTPKPGFPSLFSPPGTESVTTESSSTLIVPLNSATGQSRSSTLQVPRHDSKGGDRLSGRRAKTPALRTWRHADMVVSLRNIVLRHEHSDVEVPYARVMDFHFSGTLIAALCPAQRVKIWDTATTTEFVELVPNSGEVQQVSWRPQYSNILETTRDKYVLIRSKKPAAIRLFDAAGNGKSPILSWNRKKEVQAMCWLRGEEAFLFAEGSNVYKAPAVHSSSSSQRKRNGESELLYDFGELFVNYMLVIPNIDILIVTATLKAMYGESETVPAKPEYRIIVFDLKLRQIQSDVATFAHVNHISIHQRGMFILVCAEREPPALYELKNLENPRKRKWLDLIHHCTHPRQVSSSEEEFLGTSYLANLLPLGGQVILASTKSGVIHIWDRKFGFHLGTLASSEQLAGQTVDSIIWHNEKALLAVAYHKGPIRVWHVPGAVLHEGERDNGEPGRQRKRPLVPSAGTVPLTFTEE